MTFLLTSGGHNAGIISEPGHPRRHHRIATKREGQPYVAPEEWFTATEQREGSWWPTWQAWLAERSGDPVAPPGMGDAGAGYQPLDDAPGTYVLKE